MSIITEALRKAEQDRRLKALEAVQETAICEESPEEMPPEVRITNVSPVTTAHSIEEQAAVSITTTGTETLSASGSYTRLMQDSVNPKFFSLSVVLFIAGFFVLSFAFLFFILKFNTVSKPIVEYRKVSAPAPKPSPRAPVLSPAPATPPAVAPPSPAAVNANSAPQTVAAPPVPFVQRNVRVTPAPVSVKQILNIRPDLRLTGISASGGERYAIINDAILQENDKIEGNWVKTIGDSEVVLEGKSGEIRLTLPK